MDLLFSDKVFISMPTPTPEPSTNNGVTLSLLPEHEVHFVVGLYVQLKSSDALLSVVAVLFSLEVVTVASGTGYSHPQERI